LGIDKRERYYLLCNAIQTLSDAKYQVPRCEHILFFQLMTILYYIIISACHRKIDANQLSIFLHVWIGTGDSANAVPLTQKLRTRVTHIWGDRRGQPNRSAMERPRPGRTIAGYKLYISNRYTQYAMHRATKYNSESVHMLRLWTKIATILPNPSQNWRLTFRFIAVFKIKLPPLLIKGSVMPPAKVFAKRTAGNYTIANG